MNEKEDKIIKARLKQDKLTSYMLLKKFLKTYLDEPEKVRGLILATWFFVSMFTTEMGFLFLVGLG